jgi:hypothetical protein
LKEAIVLNGNSSFIKIIELLNFAIMYITSIIISIIWIFGPDVLHMLSNEEEYFYVSISSLIMKSNVFLYIFFDIGISSNSQIEIEI